MRLKREVVSHSLSDFKETPIILSKGRHKTNYAPYPDAIGETGVEKFGSASGRFLSFGLLVLGNCEL